ncbi:MAG: chromosome partitioning protein ParB [Candidatus Muproteobacteria bacterium RIFCSPHIGHO2_01_FULL_65_16]|uniref:Chromosome partitioning protein ParB n=2 Tax=Candidatus Muproteobacteria TaxID=1817795 RepID=A0A1F6TJD9_9PROT|nr:MAG: chromosome partitioning protein ParB [Candidatus Muproteobacteria bacterium RIFCSPHIGHO2_01_FULL_65_16]OGI52417.1 MAG: chromosome partitioning protein ParB [Candidatus Muproteobacteria bacterium RIFCSPHIGHO2_02_FULL_65_16]
MIAKKPRLGRGLDALLGVYEPAKDKEELKMLPLDMLQRGKYQPRTHMDKEALNELAASIKAQGVVQPIVVRGLPAGNYEIVAGERRWRAAQIAGLETIPAVVRRIPDEAAIAISLIENIQRENLNPVEEANALQRLIDEFGMTHQKAAEAVGRSRAAVTNLLRLLTLNADVREMLEKGRMDMGHARALLALAGKSQSQAARSVVDRGLSVRETETLVRRLLEQPNRKGARGRVDPDVRTLTQKLSDKLGAKVRINHGRKGKGKLTIEYNSLDELEGILARIR